LFTSEWKDALWDRFYTGASERQRQSVERYSVVKKACGRWPSATGSTKTVAKWKKRTGVKDLPTGPKDAQSTVLRSKRKRS
jgi:hypothetical protein